MTDEPDQSTPPPETTVIPPEPPPQPPNGNGKIEEPATISGQVRSARDMIPVSERGVSPQTYAQWIDVAKDVCRAYLMLPQHLHNNAPVMAGLLEIAARYNLSPYLLASHTYVQNDRLCFEAQAFGAMLYASNLLIGRLKYDFRGEGKDMVCVVSGRFRDDPHTIHYAVTPPLHQIHPGHVQKDGRTYVKGSSLWDKDPEQQQGYYGLRRWIRRHAPDCGAGMYTREELAELDAFRAESEGAIPLTADRLGQIETGEGWGEGAHLEGDLAAIRPQEPEFEDEEVEEERPVRRRRPAPPPAKATRGRKPVVREVRKPQRARAQAPTRKVIDQVVRRAERPRAPVQAPVPAWIDWCDKLEKVIKAADTYEKAKQAESYWDLSRAERDRLRVPVGERSRLQAMIIRKVEQLKPKEPPPS